MTTHPIEILMQAIASKQPAKVSAQIVLLEDGRTAGTVGGGKLESAILDDARLALTENLPRLPKYSLTEEGTDAVGTLCGAGERRRIVLDNDHPYSVTSFIDRWHVWQYNSTYVELYFK